MNENAYLAHHGIKGQKWGERKYQYKDGSLTPEGRKRYGVIGSTKAYIQQRKKTLEADKTRERMKSRLKTAGKVALGVGTAAAVGYGAYKVNKASGRYNRAKVYANAADIASKLRDSNGANAKEFTKFAEEARKSGNKIAATSTAMSAHDYMIRAKTYGSLSSSYSKKVSALQNYGGKSDRIAYSFVEKLAKNSSINWNDVEKLLDID